MTEKTNSPGNCRAGYEGPYLTPGEASAKVGDLCKEALSILTQDRNTQYGHPYENFKNTAKLLALKTSIDLMPSELVQALICLKESRQLHGHKKDSLLDIIGYTDILNLCIELENADPDFKETI